MKQQLELEDCEFDKYCFETLPKARGSVHHEKVSSKEYDICEIQITYDNPENSELSVKLPIDDERFASLQEKDPKSQDLCDKVINDMYKEFNIVKSNVLFRSIVEMATSSKLEAFQSHRWM